MEAYYKIRSHLWLGNLNIAIQLTALHQTDLRSVLRFLIPEIATQAGSRRHLLSSDSRQALKALGVVPRPVHQASWPKQEPGEMVFPAVASNAAGCIRWLRVNGRRDGNASEPRLHDLDRVGAAVFRSLRTRTQRSWNWNPHYFRLNILCPDGTEECAIGGNSLDLALAVSLFSLVSGVPVPSNISASAEVRRAGRLYPVRGLTEKMDALSREAWWIKRLIVAAGQKLPEQLPRGLRVLQAANLDQALAYAFPDPVELRRTTAMMDLDQEIARLEALYNDYLMDTVIDNATTLIHYLQAKPHERTIAPENRYPALFTCLWRRGSSWCHKGNTAQAIKDMAKAQQLYKRNPQHIPPEKYSGCRVNFAVTLKDVFRYPEAEALHHVIQAELEQTRRPAYEIAKNLSSLSQLCLAQGRFDDAIRYQKDAIKKMSREEVHRNYCYLAQIHGRAERFAPARKALAKAGQRILGLDQKSQQRHRLFYHWAQAELLYRQGVSTRRNIPQCLATSNNITALYPEVTHYAMALIYKFAGLLNIAAGSDAKGLKHLDSACQFLEKSGNPMFYLLAASVHSHRALHFIGQQRMEEAQMGVALVCSHLRFQKSIRRFFQEMIRHLSAFNRTRKFTAIRAEAARNALLTIIEKIPY